MGRTLGQPAPLFQRLPHGPSGLGREEVARNQRIRIYGGMIESVHRSGYAASTVADVIALAGVSRRAFYEQFSNKEDCFLATYDIVVARARRQLTDAWEAQRGWSNRLDASSRALFTHIATSPKGPQLVLVDSIGIGPRGRDRMHASGLTFELLVSQLFQRAPDGVAVSPLTARAIVGGARHVLSLRMLEGRTQELGLLSDDVLDWIEGYRSPAAVRLGVAGPIRPPGKASVQEGFLAARDRRSRALAAIVCLIGESGYGALTDAQIARAAGISTEAFHREFASRQACLLAVLDEFLRETLERVRAASSGAASWPQSVHSGMAAFLEHLAAHPDLSRIAFVDLFEVGPAIVGRTTRLVDVVVGDLTVEAPEARHGPAVAGEALTGGVWAVLAGAIAGGGAGRLLGLADHLAFVTLAPYLGPKAAAEAIQASRGRSRAA
jgi:AcrR family transcriptional regulator